MIEVNRLVTTFEFKLGKGVKEYDKLLIRLDRQGAKVAANASKALERSFGGAAKRIGSQFDGMFRGIQRQADGLKLRTHVSIDNSQAKARIKEVDTLATGLTRKLGRMAMGVGGGVAGLGAVKRFGEELFNTVGEKQSNMGRLTTQMGGEKPAKAIFEWLRREAERTPFEKNELISGFSAIKGSGYQLTQADLTGLGDVTAGSKKSFNDMIEMLKSANRGLGNMVDNFDGLKARSEDGELLMERFDKQLGKWVSQTFQPGDMKGIIGFVRTHGERNYRGEMDRQSRTLPGLGSTLKDKITSRLEDIGDAGMDKTMTRIMNKLVGFAEKAEPWAKKFGGALSKGLDKAEPLLHKMAKWVPLVAKGAALIGTYLFGAKVLKVVGFLATKASGIATMVSGFINLARMAGPIATLGTSFGVISTALMPLLVGGGLAALAGLGFKIWQYWTEGDKALEGLRQKFPGLADGIKYLGDATKEWWPHLKVAGNLIKNGIEGGFKAMAPVAKWALEKVLVPGVTWVINRFADLFKGIKIIYETAMPALVTAWYFWEGVVKDFFAWAEPKFKKLKEWIDETRNAAATDGGFSNAKIGAPGGGPGGSGGSGAGAPSALGLKMIKFAAGIATPREIKDCLRVIWRAQNLSLGGAEYGSRSPIKALNAADAAPQLANSADFVEFKARITHAMLQDPYYKKLFNGSTAIYDRNSGFFSSTAGHAEIWDTMNGVAYYGKGADPISRRTQGALDHVRLFLPKEKAQELIVAMNKGKQPTAAQTPAAAPKVEVTVNYAGNGTMASVQSAVKRGVEQAMTQSASKYPQASPRR